MGNCTTPTCAIDGKITPDYPDGTPLDVDSAVNADRCGERGRRGERRGARDPGDSPAPPRRDVTLGLDPRQPSSTIAVEQTRYPGGGRDATQQAPADRDVAFNGVVPRRGGGSGGGGSASTDASASPPVTLVIDQGSDVTGYRSPPVTLVRSGNPGEVVTLAQPTPQPTPPPTPETQPTRTASAPTQAELDAMSPKDRLAYQQRAARHEAEQPAGALEASPVDNCYRAFLALPTDLQLRVLTSGTLARYALIQAVVRDAMSGDAHAPRVGADWLFGTFQRNSREVVQFCTAVSSFMNLNVRPSGFVVLAGGAADRWTRGYNEARGALAREFRPGGELALIDGRAALQLFAILPAADQANILRGAAFLGDAYATALANALAGPGTIDGVLVSDLLAGHMAQLSEGDPRLILFQLAVQDASRGHATAAAGFIRPAGTPPTPPARTAAATTTRAPTAAAAAATTPAPAAAALPAEFLAQSGLNATQWAALLSEHPDVATQLWHEFQTRPSTFSSVSAAALQAIGVIITGIHQGRVDDLAAANAQYAHQQAMAQLAAARSSSADAAEIARLQAAANATQQTVMQYQTPAPAPAPAPAPPPPEGITVTQVGVGVLLLAVLGGGAYLLTRRKHNGRPQRKRRKPNRHDRRRARRLARAS